MEAAKLEELKTSLRPAFERHGVRLAYLFGSQATGRTHAESDTDIAVLLPKALTSDVQFEARLDLIGAAMDACRSEEVDVAVLNDASPLLCFEVLRHGILLYKQSEKERVDFQVRTCLEYEDTAPLRRKLEAAKRKRIASGRFGRAPQPPRKAHAGS